MLGITVWILYMISNDKIFEYEKILGLRADRTGQDKKQSLEARADAFLCLKILWDSLLRTGLNNTHRAVLLHHVLQNEFSKQVQTKHKNELLLNVLQIINKFKLVIQGA